MLTITANTFAHIQKQFNDQFPFLKLDFFQHQSNAPEGNSQPSLPENDSHIQSIKKNYTEISLNENMPVRVAEQLFLQKYGITIQILRKSGNSWLETSLTDDWTLKRQNDEGKELSILFDTK